MTMRSLFSGSSIPVAAELSLYEGQPPAVEPEQWEKGRDGSFLTRNVSWPTITPFLPDPAKATGAAALIAPGGGFRLLAIETEGAAAARWLAERGVAAFLLKYRTAQTPRPPAEFAAAMAQKQGVPDYTEALADVRAALGILRARAAEWRLDPQRIGMMGFSAGAMLTLDIGLAPEEPQRPAFLLPIYGPLTARHIPAGAPPLFTILAADDPYFAAGGFELISQYAMAGLPVEFHLYQDGGHAFGLNRQGKTIDSWPEQLSAWMQSRGLL